LCDTTALPDEVGRDYDLIVYDPPHMNCGPTSDMSARYGYWTTKQILSTVFLTSKEAARVSKDSALMAFKWNTHDIKLERVLDLMPDWEPLFGHMTKNGAHSQTFWVMLKKVSQSELAPRQDHDGDLKA
jgi:hypothetical protein